MPDQTSDLITQLIQAQAAEKLRACESTLAFALHIVRNGWLPVDDEPGVQQHLYTLRQHMAEIGHPENDGFLLRLGLTAPGMQRGIVPPLMVLDANRGGFPPRRLNEAAGQVLQLRNALAIGRRFVSDLSRDTQQAIVELAEWVRRQPVVDGVVWFSRFNEISSEGAEQLAERAIQFLDNGEEPINEIGIQLLQQLACLRQSALSEKRCQALIERRVYWPSSIYRDSGDVVARQLISRIGDATGELELNHLLLALAWTRSAAACQAFDQWSKERPDWALKLRVPPEVYTHHAGWCLGDDGQRRDLISARCFRLVLAEKPAKRRFRCRTRIDERVFAKLTTRPVLPSPAPNPLGWSMPRRWAASRIGCRILNTHDA